MPFIVKNANDAKQFVSQLAARRETSEGQEGELDRYIRYLGYEIERQNKLPPDKQDSFYIMNLSTLLNHAVRLNRLVGESVEALANNDQETARRQLQAAAATAERMNLQLQAISTSFDADRTRGADDALRLNLTTPLEAVVNPPWRKYGALGGYYQAPEMPEAIREGGDPEIDDDMNEQEIREAQSRAYEERRQQWDWVIGQSFGADPPACSHEEVVTLLARSVAARLLRDDRPPQKYDKKKLDRFTEEVKRNPNFQFLTRDEATSVGYMTQPGALEMLRDATMGLYVDGTRRDRESVNNSLDSLGSAMRHMIPERNRSDEWKNFHDSLSNYTREMVNDQGLPVRPGEPGGHPRYGAIRSPYRVGDMKEDGKPFTVPERVDEVFTGIEKYIKGKKSLRSTPEEQERFDLAMDALAIVAKTSPAARARAEAIVARINYVRTHRPWFQKPQPTINLEDYGRERGRDAIRRRLVREGLSEEKANLLVPQPQNLGDLVQPVAVNAPVRPAQEENVPIPPAQEENVPVPPAQEGNAPVQPAQEGNVPVPPVQEGNAPVQPAQEGNVPVQPVQEGNGEQQAQEENAQPVEVREIVESGEMTGIYREKPEEMTALPVRTITGQIERIFDGLDNLDDDQIPYSLRNAFVKALALDGLELYHSTDEDGNDISVVDYEKFKEEENRLRDSREIAVLMETVINDEALAEKLIMDQEGERKQAKDIPELTRQLKELLPAARQKAEAQQKAEEEQKKLLRQQEQSEIMKNPELPHHIKNARSVKQMQNRILDEINALSDEDEPDIGKPLSKVLALSKCTLYRAKTKQGNYVTAIDRDELNQIAQGISDLPEFQEFIDSFDNDPDRLSEFLENEDGDPVTFEEFVSSLKDGFQQFREERAREKAAEEQQNLQSEEEQAHMEEQDALDGQEAVPQPEEEAEEAEEMLACDVLNSDLAKKLPEKADLQNPVEITKLQSDVRSCFLSYTAGEKSDNALAKGIALSMINAYRMNKNGRTIAVVDKEELEKATHNVKSSKAFQTLTSRLKDDTQYAENFADDKQLMEQMGVELHIKLPMAKMTKKLVEEFQNYEKIVGEAAPEEQAQAQEKEQAQAQKPLTALDVESAEQILSLPQGNAANVTTLSDLRKEATDFRTALYHGRVDVVYKPQGGAAINPREVTENKLSRILAMGELPLERQTIGGQVFAVVDEDKLQKRADEIRKDKHFRVMIERMEKDRNCTRKLTQDWRNNMADFSIFYQNIKQSYDESLGLADELGRKKIEQRRVENREKWKAAHQRWQEQKEPELPEGPVELVPLGHDGIPLPPKEGPAIVPYQIAPGVFVPHPELIPPEPVEIVRTNPIAYDPAKVPAEQLPVKKLAHPAQVRGTVLLLNSMSEKFSKGKTASAFAKDPVTVVARAIALKGMTVYRGERDGKPCAVVNGALLRKRVDALKENPVVQAMAKDLAEKPEYRRKLTSEIRDFPDAERLADAITEEFDARSLEYKAQQNDRLVSGGKTPSAVACIAGGVKLEDLPQKKLRNPVPFDGTLNSYKYHAQAIAQGKYPKQLQKDPVAQVAKVLALSQLAGYQGEVNGRSVPVVDGDILSKKLEMLTADPAVQKLAEKMADPEFRKTLATAENPQGAPEPVSGAKMIENICSQYDAISKVLADEKAKLEAQKAQEEAQKAQKEVQDALKQGQQKEADRDINPPAAEKQDGQLQADGNQNGPIVM